MGSSASVWVLHAVTFLGAEYLGGMLGVIGETHATQRHIDLDQIVTHWHRPSQPRAPS
jgi:hypothetical protein